MKKLIFLFTDGSSFKLDLPEKLNRKTLCTQIGLFQKMILQMESDHLRFASGKTKFKLPISRPSWVGMDDGKKVVPVWDNNGNAARFKGFSMLNKQGTGKDRVFSVNPDYARFLTDRILRQSTQADRLGSLEKLYLDHVEQAEQQKVKRLAPVVAE